MTSSTEPVLVITSVDYSLMTSSNASNVFERYTWVEFMQVHAPTALLVDRIITPLWYTVGFVGNLLSACVWLQRRVWTSNSSAVYLATISIADLIFLLLHVLQEFKYAWSIEATGIPVICELYSVAYMATQYISPTLVLGFTVERYIAVCHPFSKERLCTVRGAVRVTTWLVTTCIALAAAQAYYWTYDSSNGQCRVRQMAADGHQSTMWTVWSWLTEMTVFLVVPLVALLFNICVIVEVRRLASSTCRPVASPTSQSLSSSSLHQKLFPVNQLHPISASTTVNRNDVDMQVNQMGHIATLPTQLRLQVESAQRRQQAETATDFKIGSPSASRVRSTSTVGSPSSTATTVMLLSVSFYVIVTTLPATLVYVLESEFPEGNHLLSDEEISADPTWMRYLAYILSRKIVEEICLSHYACNIMLYVVTGKHFRAALFDLIGFSRKRKHRTIEYSTIGPPRITFASSMI